MPGPYGISTAGTFDIGKAYIIVSLGSTDWNTAANTVLKNYKVGDVFTAVTAGAGTGTARRIVNDSLGRIDGKLLADNLLRHGIDLSVDTDLLYLAVSNSRIGIKTTPPLYTLDIQSLVKSTDIIVVTQAAIGNLRLNAPDTISTAVGGIDVYINGSGVIFHDRVQTDNLILNDNFISSSSNSNIVFDPNGTGTVELKADTAITGDLTVSGNISITGDLSKQGNLILGDDVIDGEGNVPENDLVDFNAPFSQDLVPGADNAFDLGGSLGDSTAGRWRSASIPDWTNITTIIPNNAVVSDQIFFNGSTSSITALQSNDDISLDPATGIGFVEATRWQNASITNLSSTALTVTSTGIGYYVFAGVNGIVIPAGNNATRPISPEVADTRWNTEEGYLECFDGSIYIIATGPGIAVIEPIMEELGTVFTLILG